MLHCETLPTNLLELEAAGGERLCRAAANTRHSPGEVRPRRPHPPPAAAKRVAQRWREGRWS